MLGVDHLFSSLALWLSCHLGKGELSQVASQQHVVCEWGWVREEPICASTGLERALEALEQLLTCLSHRYTCGFLDKSGSPRPAGVLNHLSLNTLIFLSSVMLLDNRL